MSPRGIVALVALLATGIVGGFSAAAYLDEPTVISGANEPVEASSPSIPVDPELLKPDPTEPPMGVGLTTTTASLGSGDYRITFPVPQGWKRLDSGSSEVKYKVPGNPSQTFVLRIEQVDGLNKSIPDLQQQREDEFRRQQQDVDKPPTSQTYDTLQFSYVYEGYKRFTYFSWLDLSRSGEAEVEIQLTGREVDVPGMEALLKKIQYGLERG